jgi:outer membrane biosynthesis protein TonB
MTTSEFILGHSADDATERKQEVRKVLWALLAALFLHLIIALSIATFGGMFSSTYSVEEDKPIEMTIVDLSTPAPIVSKNSMFMETDESKQSTEQPKDRTFESNANSIAATQLSATGGLPLPSQQGKDRPFVDLETHQYSLPNEGARPQPSVRPQETPKPSAAPTPLSTPISEAEQFAMLTRTATPTVQPSTASKPEQPKSSYRPQKERTRVSGSITTRGISSVNAVGTPLGRYEKLLFDAIGSRWYGSVEDKLDLFSIGTTRVIFRVDRDGHINNLKVVENTSNELFVNFCLQSVQEARLPAMPDDLAATLPPEGLEVDLPFTIFANQ